MSETKGAAVSRRFVRDYERGLYTHGETISRFIGAAVEHPPEELAQPLSVEWLEMIRTETSTPPQSPSDIVPISGILGAHGFDYEAYFAAARQTCFEGTWRWHCYFAATVEDDDSAEAIK